MSLSESAGLHETKHSSNLNDAENKFCFAVTFNAKKIDADDDEEEYRHPCRRIDAVCTVPEGNGDRRSDDFKGECDEPGECVAIFRSISDTPCRHEPVISQGFEQSCHMVLGILLV